LERQWSSTPGRKTVPLGKILGAPPVVFLGLISYSLYLWHWPLIVFADPLSAGLFSAAQSTGVSRRRLFLAALSWRFVEQPFRGRASPINRQVLFIGAAVAVGPRLRSVFSVTSVRDGPDACRRKSRRSIGRAMTWADTQLRSASWTTKDGSGPSLADIREGSLCGMGAGDARNVSFSCGGIHMPPRWDRQSMLRRAKPAITPDGRQRLVRSASRLRRWTTNRLKVARCKEVNAAVVDLIAKKRISTVFMIAAAQIRPWREYGNEGVFLRIPRAPYRLTTNRALSAMVSIAPLSVVSQLGGALVRYGRSGDGTMFPYTLAKSSDE